MYEVTIEYRYEWSYCGQSQRTDNRIAIVYANTHKEAIEKIKTADDEFECSNLVSFKEISMSFKEVFNITNNELTADVMKIQRGEWIEKEHWVPLPRDYEVSYDEDYDECYDEKTHSWKTKYWHCSCCDYEASRDMKPWFDYCPRCGAKMDVETK